MYIMATWAGVSVSVSVSGSGSGSESAPHRRPRRAQGGRDRDKDRDVAEIVFDVHHDRSRPRPPAGVADGHILWNGDILVPNEANDVHDHQIQRSVRESIARLKSWYTKVGSGEGAGTCRDSMREIKHYIFSCDSIPDHKEKAYNVFRSIERSDEQLHSVGLTETAILDMVWRRICDVANQGVVTELKHSLLEALVDSAITVDMPYCLTGRISRIIQSLQCLDHDGIVDIRSLDIIRLEVQNKVPVLIRDYFKAHPEQEALFDSGAPLSDQLRLYIEEQLKSDLVMVTDMDNELSEVIAEQLGALVL
jgi:bacterioferritin-associated ferredoxin